MLESRVRDPKKRGNIQTKIGQASPAYCVLCGERCGFVTEAGTGLVIAVATTATIQAVRYPGFNNSGMTKSNNSL